LIVPASWDSYLGRRFAATHATETQQRETQSHHRHRAGFRNGLSNRLVGVGLELEVRAG